MEEKFKKAWEKMPKNADLVIEKFFMRVIKNNSLYLKLRTSMDSIGVGCGLNSGQTFHSVCEKCFQEAKAIFSKHQVDGSPYEYITLAINALLSKLIEGMHIGNQEICVKIGSQTFDLVCNYIFHDEWEKEIEELDKNQKRRKKEVNDFIDSAINMVKASLPNASAEQIENILFKGDFINSLPPHLKAALVNAYEEGAFDFAEYKKDI